MNWQKMIVELETEVGEERLAKLLLANPRTLRAIKGGRTEPSYSLGDRIVRMHDNMREMRPWKKESAR